MSNITWTIRVRNNSTQRKLWGDGIESCWNALRRMAADLHPTQQIILKILYHEGCMPPDHIRAGISQFSSVAVYFDHQSTSTRIWHADHVDVGRRLSCCSRWNVSDVESFITYYTS